MEQAIKYFIENIITVNQTAIKFNIDRKVLMKELKNREINPSKFSVEKFINISNIVHNNKYDYSAVKSFKKVKNKVQIICPIHGKFEQDIYSHKIGKGCPKCGDIKTSKSKYDTTQSFILKAKKVHKNLYDYFLVNYKNTKER